MHFSEYDMECITKAKDLIDTDFSIHIHIYILAQKCGIGATKLKAGFKKYFGDSPFTYLRKQRMIKAGELICGSNKTLKQIAKATGFKHTNNFMTAFRAYYHITPRHYRQLHPND